MLEELIESEDERPADRRVKPALLTLLHDQAALLDRKWADDDRDYDLRSGFDSRRQVIEWYQQAAVRSKGHIADDWKPADCFIDRTMLAALIREDVDGIDTMDSYQAVRWREWLETAFVMPAFNRAYRDLRKSAVEYIKTPDSEERKDVGEGDLDPTQQKHVAMRPGFQTLDDQQGRALRRLWGGFESHSEMLDWLHSLNYPTNGEIGENLAASIVSDPAAMDHLIYERESRTARIFREAMAVGELLPAFVDGVKGMDTGELAKKKQTTPTTLRQKGGYEDYE